MRWSPLVAVLLLVTLVTGCGEDSSSAGQRSASPGQGDAGSLLLRLRDLPRGYRVGNDNGCGTGVEGAPPRLAQIVTAYRPAICTIDFSFAYAGDHPAVQSAAYVFQTQDAAQVAFEDRAEAFAYVSGIQGPAERAVDGFGDEARLLTTLNALVDGRSRRPGVAVLWRQGTVLSFVLVAGSTRSRAERIARTLARKQRRRILTPTPLLPSDNDDREVALDDPRRGVDVYWLGRQLRASGPLPALRLARSFGPTRPGAGPGGRLQIEYDAPTLRVTGVTLDLWTPAAWKRYRTTKLGSLVWNSPCAHATTVSLRAGRAVIYGGYGSPPRGRGCPHRPFDRYVAHVYFAHVIVVVNMPYCLTCAPRATDSTDPYNSLRGMQAIVRGLHARGR